MQLQLRPKTLPLDERIHHDEHTLPARRSLRLAVLDHMPHRAALLLSEEFVLPLGMALQATASQIGVLTTLPRIVSSFSQLAASRIAQLAGGTRQVLVGAALLGALAFAGMAMVPAAPEGSRVWLLIAMAVLAHLFLELPNPVWGTWIGATVPLRRRGRFLAMRLGLGSASAVAVFISTAWLIDHGGDPVRGLALVFAFAACLRLLSAAILRGIAEPRTREPLVQRNASRFDPRALFRTGLGRFMLLSFGLHFSVFVAAPYIGVYQLRELGFSYFSFAALVAVYIALSMVSLRFWGPLADRKGNVIGIRLSVLGIAVLPLLWLPVLLPWHGIVAQVVSGIAWGGFALCGLNFVFEASTPSTRGFNVALYNALNGLGMFLGALLGGVLLPLLPSLFGSPLLTLFVLSAVLRAAAAVGLFRWVRELRQAHRSVVRL